MDELEIAEARYDAMPPEIIRVLRHCNADPLSHRHNTLKTEVAFARRMFRANQRVRKTRRHDPVTRQRYREDCRHWWRRYRKAQASATQINQLLALTALNKSIAGR